MVIKKGRIIDCFILFNEIELLKYRMESIGNEIDWFILVESKYTFTGIEKELYYKKMLDSGDEILTKWKEKTIYIIINEFPNKVPFVNEKEVWLNESYQRNTIEKGLNYLHFNNQDICILSDVDEIPNPHCLKYLHGIMQPNIIYAFDQDFYYYNLHTRVMSNWTYAKCFLGKINGLTLDEIRWNGINNLVIKNGGWHLSYFGGLEQIKSKINAFSHQEHNNKEILDNIEKSIMNKTDLFHRKNIVLIHQHNINNNLSVPPNIDICIKNGWIIENK